MSSISKIGLSEKTIGGSLFKQKKEIANCPEYPSWVNERLYLSWDFYPNPEKFENVRNDRLGLQSLQFGQTDHLNPSRTLS